MAFNHVGDCSCPVGCCDCGPANPHEETDKIVYLHIKSLIPQDIYMLKELYDTETYIYERDRTVDPCLGSNEFYIGQVDPVLTMKDAVGICFAFYGWLFSKGYTHEDNGAKYMRDLIRRLQDTGDFKEALRPELEVLYTKTRPYL